MQSTPSVELDSSYQVSEDFQIGPVLRKILDAQDLQPLEKKEEKEEVQNGERD